MGENAMVRLGIAKAAAVLAIAAAFGAPPSAGAADSKIFNMVPSAGAKTCLPEARGRVTLNSLNTVESMHVEVFGLPEHTDFDVFLIQIPGSPFGLSWYQGDIETNSSGNGVSDFSGRFSKETFIVAPGPAPAPKVFPDNATTNPKTAPVQIYHLGIWFNSPKDAAKAGCAATVTPFNGTHNAGIQVLNTSNFPNLSGPLRNFNP